MKKFKFLLASITALSLSNAVLPLSANTTTEETTAIVEETTTTIEEETTTVEETEEITEETVTPEVKGDPIVVADIVATTFPDPILQAAVMEALDDDGVTNPTLDDLANITELRSMDFVESIVGIETLTSIESLLFFGSTVTDFSVLGNLTNLQQLALVHSGLTAEDLGFLTNLTKLEELALKSNSITDVTFLSGMTHLDSLILDNNYISDVTPLAGLTSTELYLNNNNIIDVTPLVNVPDFVATNQKIFYSSDFPTGPFDYLIWSVGVKHPDVNIIPSAISHGGVYDAAEQGIKFTELSAANTPAYTFGSRAGIAPALPSDADLDTLGDILRPETRMSHGQELSRDFSGTVLFVFSATETDTETVPTLPNTGLSDMGTIAGVSSLAGSAVLMAVRKKIRK